MARDLVVRIVGDASSLERAFKKSEKSAKRFERSMGGTSRRTSRQFATIGGGISGKGLLGIGGAAAVFATLKSSISAASDLEQQIGKTNVVFGKSAREVEDWSESLASSFGLSQREALTTASTLGALFAPIGLTGKAAAEQSMKLTELGADLASFYNTDVASALDALRSGLVGEAEPLRKFGILLSEARVQQQAMADSGKRTASELTNQEKTLARIKIILQDSKVAQGDFGRTADQAAQQTKIFRAELENLKTNLARDVIPFLGKAVGALNDFFQAFKGPEEEGTVRKEGIETVLVPLIAKRIAAAKKAGKGGKQILAELRAWLGDSQKANDLIAEGFTFSRDAKLRAAIRKQARDRKKAPVVPGADDGLTKAQREARRGRIRRAAEATRQALRDRAAFAVDKTALTKTLADDLAALRRYNALLVRQMKGGHKTLELEREQLSVQLQIQEVLRQQADAHKKQQAQKKRMGVDVARFQKTARGQFVRAGARGGGSGVVITGGVHLHGIRNMEQMERELQKRKRQRAGQRRSNRG